MSQPRRAAWAVASLALSACAGPVAVEDLPTARETLRDVAARLGRQHSERTLTELAADGRRVLAALRRPERDALGRSWLRFRVDRPVVVAVAAPAGHVPYWVEGRGFRPTGDRLDGPDGPFRVFERAFPAGWVGLGVNGLDRSSPSHYAVFVRPAAGGGPVRIDESIPQSVRAVRGGVGASPFDDADLPFRALPPRLASSWVVPAERGRRHGAALIRDRAWKTHVPSSPAPDQVAIAFGADAARQLSWTWRTDASVTTTALRLAPAADPGAVRVHRGDSALVAVDDLVNDPVTRRHRVRVGGLEPDTAYAYALGDGPGRTLWQQVRTGPAAARPYSFMYLGDPQTGLEGWGDLLKSALRRRPDVGFVLIAGDLVDRGEDRSNWDHFFLRAAGPFDGVPVMPAAGNHEYLDAGARLYRATFRSLPANGPEGMAPGLGYAFRYADALVVALDSTAGVESADLADRQARWLDATLAADRSTWRFVMFHHPLYASHTWREQPALRDAWAPVLDRHRVDIAFQGHDHAYLRTHPLAGGRPAAGGTTYVVAVSGDKYCDQDPRDYTARGFTRRSTYQVIDIDPGSRRLTYRACDARGATVDEFALAKPEADPSSPTARVARRDD